jgi:hypothetical protein
MRYVIALMEGRLKGLSVSWNDVTVSEIYSVHDIHPFLKTELLERQQAASAHGLTWQYSHPPIDSIETKWISVATLLNW